MYDIYFYWENRQSATKTLRESFSEAIEAAQEKAQKHSRLMSVEIVDENYARVIMSREELLKVG